MLFHLLRTSLGLKTVSLVWLAVFTTNVLGQSSPATYHIRILNMLEDSTSSQANAVNDAGQIVGDCWNANGQGRAVLWSADGAIRELEMPSGYTSSSARSINNAGQIIGSCRAVGGPEIAARWSAEGRIMSSEIQSSSGSSAVAISEKGEVVVNSQFNSTQQSAFRWSANGAMMNLPPEIGSQVFAINGSGQTTGSVFVANSRRAVRWSVEGTPTELALHPVFTSSYSYGAFINEAGQIAGISRTDLPTILIQAVRWSSSGAITVLDSLDGRIYSSPSDINGAGEVVGFAYAATGRRAVHWAVDGTVTDLGTLGGSSSEAYAFTKTGQIIGNSSTEDSDLSMNRGFIYSETTGMRDINDLVGINPLVTGIAFSPGDGRTSRSNLRGELVANGTVGGESRSLLLIPMRRPLVFIPGIAGSMLTGNGETGLNGNGEYLWPTVGAQDIRALNLSSNVTDVRAVGILREYSPSNWFPDIGKLIVYGPLMDYLTGSLGYEEFDFKEYPERMTNNFLQGQAWSRKPTLFTFPYDWRRANADHADKLRDYIANIKQLHRAEKVDFIAHSMGGLVLRQYILKYGTADIGKVITIGTPVWGSPKAVYRMLTGKFYDSVVDWDTSRDMKAALRSMPSTAELISPFHAGHISGRSKLLSESGWNLNESGGDMETFSPAIFWNYINEIAPGFEAANKALHVNSQDDWSTDTGEIRYLQIHGLVTVDGKPTTTTDVVAFETLSDNNRGGYIVTRGYKENKGPGDNVVPLESGNRPAEHLAPNTTVFPILADNNVASKNTAEHTEMTKNPIVHAEIARFLGFPIPPDPATPSGMLAAAPHVPVERKRVTLYGCSYALITDAAGNQNTRLNEMAIQKIPEMEINYQGEDGWMEVECAADAEFTFEDPASTRDIEAKIVTYGSDGVTTSLTRYRYSPDNQAWELSVLSRGAELKLDADRSGSFTASEIVPPSHSVTGVVDETPPTISMTLDSMNGTTVVTLAGTDNAGGVTILYTLDGAPTQVYTAPIPLSASVGRLLRVFTEDAAGNTSGLIETEVNPQFVITSAGPAITLTWPRSDAYVLEESDSLADGSWKLSTNHVIQREFNESVTITSETHARRFFRLRSQTVAK